MSAWVKKTFALRVAVRDCQTQTLSQADLELALLQAEENANNHQIEPEASVTLIDVSPREGKKDQPLRNSTDTNQDRQEVQKPLNSLSAPGKGQIQGKRQRQIKGQGGNPGNDPNAPDDPTANVKRFAKYAFGAAFIGVGIFVVVPSLLGLTTAGAAGAYMVPANAASVAGASVMSASAAGSAGAASVGAAAGLSFGGAAAITGLYAAGGVTVGAVRYITRRKNRRPTKDADTQTDLDKSE